MLLYVESGRNRDITDAVPRWVYKPSQECITSSRGYKFLAIIKISIILQFSSICMMFIIKVSVADFHAYASASI